MLNYIWFGMLIAGIVIGIMNGRVEAVTQAAMISSGDAVELCIGLMGVMCLWSGLMEIARRSGLVTAIARLVHPVMKLIFPEVPGNHPAMGAMLMNLAANMLGLGNAATPLGIKAMGELQRLNTKKDTSTDAMSMFLVLNTSVIQLIPATIIALRVKHGSCGPADVIGTIWIASVCATIAGVTAARLLSSGHRKKSRRR